MGVDFSYYTLGERDTIKGVVVQSIFPGRVAAAFTTDTIPYGYAVVVETQIEDIKAVFPAGVTIDTQDSLYVMYAHLDQPPQVTPGEEVRCGTHLGFVGQTGGVSTPYLIPHLHVEMRVGPRDQRFDEMGFYDTRLSEAARQSYQRWRLSGEFRHFDPMLILAPKILED
jgi:murein DD-endopeptidase MepM/ murein hydrolase activator NlpD